VGCCALHSLKSDVGRRFAQSLHYALVTGKKAGIVLIVENEGEGRFWARLNAVIEEYSLPITVWRRGGIEHSTFNTELSIFKYKIVTHPRYCIPLDIERSVLNVECSNDRSVTVSTHRFRLFPDQILTPS